MFFSTPVPCFRHLALFCALSTLYSSVSAQWQDIPATSYVDNTLNWLPCPDVLLFECALFQVPMDWTIQNDTDLVTIAMRRLPSLSDNPKGTILFNGGGPGISGTNAILLYGPAIASKTAGEYHVASWDPRGINYTQPSLNCTPTPEDLYNVATTYQSLGYPIDYRGGTFYPKDANPGYALSTNAYFNRLAAQQKAIRNACVKNGNHKMLRSSSSTFTARDLRAMSMAAGDAKLNYWGISYGTVIGSIYMALFPDQLGKVVLDGVVNMPLITSDSLGLGIQSTTDIDRVFNKFCADCAASANCSLNNPSRFGSPMNAAKIRSIIQDLATDMTINPRVVNNKLIGASDLYAFIGNAVYLPQAYDIISAVLLQAIDGDASGIAAVTQVALPSELPYFNIDLQPANTANSLPDIFADAAVLCTDTNPISLTTAELQNYTTTMGNKAISGEFIAYERTVCSDWPFQAIERYSGPWTIQDGLRPPTSPVLFLSLQYDSSTDLTGATTTAQGFGSNVVLRTLVNAYGHTSFAIMSDCYDSLISNYFANGTIPIRRQSVCVIQ